MRRTKEEAEITCQKLLATALQVFSRKGYAETRLEDIAAEARARRGAICHHSGSKADLYNAMLTESSSRAVESWTCAAGRRLCSKPCRKRRFTRAKSEVEMKFVAGTGGPADTIEMVREEYKPKQACWLNGRVLMFLLHSLA